MKMEKLTENKIRIIIKIEELSDTNIDLKDFMNNQVQSQKFFLDILDKAEKELGFITKDCKLLIEAFSSLDEMCVFTITKCVQKNKKPTLKIKKLNNKKYLANTVYKFDSFEEFCALCNFLEASSLPINNIAKKVSLYYLNNTYYLVFIKLNLNYKYMKKFLNIVCEFSTVVKNNLHFEAKLLEYGKPIIKQNALKTGIKYFN